MVRRTPSPNNSFLDDPLVKKMVNLLIRDGKKSKAEKLFRKLFLFIQKAFPGQALQIFYLAVFNTQTLVGNRVKPRGKKYRKAFSGKDSFVPHFFSHQRSQTLAIRSLVVAGRKRLTPKPLYENLSYEIIQAALQKSEIVSNKYIVYTQAGLNRRFYRFRWKRSFPGDTGQTLLRKHDVRRAN